MTTFKNRVFGAAIVKAVNSNYNADFSGQPRTLPSGQVYATDKAFKYTLKNYIKDIFDEKIFYFKKFNNDLKPLSLDENFIDCFDEFPTKTVTKTVKGKKETKEEIVSDRIVFARNLLTLIDIRLFGATYAGEENISIHGPVQVNHGINIWNENNIFSEQIMSPFRNSDEKSVDKSATTLGRQSKLEEGHYLHHFSVNPKNLEEVVKLAGEGSDNLSEEDINKLKEAMRRGATYYDSASKAGTDNEFIIWVQLNETSKLVLPNFSQLITLKNEKENGKVVLDLAELNTILNKHSDDIEKIEIYRNDVSIKIENKPENAKIFDL